MKRFASVCVLAFGSLTACAGEDGPPDGYRRFEPEPIMVPAGTSGQWIQYVSGPVEQDMDVIDIRGEQGLGGHHAILYASPITQPVGTTREWRATDQVTDRFLGGVGGEGAEDLSPPEGGVFRVPAGFALYVNVHYYNAGDEPIEGRSQIDVKLDPASSSRTAVGFLGGADVTAIARANTTTEFSYSCKLKADTKLVMFSNHMHEYGKAVHTTARVPGGEAMMLKEDPAWNYEWATNPNFTRRPISDPLVLPAGTEMTTTCSWNNTTNRDLAFPDEMCAFLGFHLDTADRHCAPMAE
jgi:hypothetical protein